MNAFDCDSFYLPIGEILLIDKSLRNADVVEANLTKHRVGAGTRRLFLGELIRDEIANCERAASAIYRI